MDLLIRFLVVVFACIGFSVVLGGAAALVGRLKTKSDETEKRRVPAKET